MYLAIQGNLQPFNKNRIIAMHKVLPYPPDSEEVDIRLVWQGRSYFSRAYFVMVLQPRSIQFCQRLCTQEWLCVWWFVYIIGLLVRITSAGSHGNALWMAGVQQFKLTTNMLCCIGLANTKVTTMMVDECFRQRGLIWTPEYVKRASSLNPISNTRSSIRSHSLLSTVHASTFLTTWVTLYTVATHLLTSILETPVTPLSI